MITADELLAQVLATLPVAEHSPLVLEPGETLVPATAVLDRTWLDEQIRLRGLRWNTDDRKVLATLWWYSASVWIPLPALTSLAVTGRALSPALDDVEIHWLPDSRITGGTSSAVLTETDPVRDLGRALHEMLGTVISVVAEAGGMTERPLWAISTDALANRMLQVGRLTGSEDHAVALAAELAAAVGPELLPPRYDHIEVDAYRHVRVTRRSSCCLLYRAPAQSKCASCPKQTEQVRRGRLLAGELAG